MSAHYQPGSHVSRFFNSLEETLIAVILGAMTVVTFVNVVLRYVFNSMLIWGLETTLILFAWLVLLGVSYGFKVTAHLGVDALLNAVPSRPRRMLILASGLLCIVYALLILKGAWDYWAPFASLDATSGRWFPTGFAQSRDQAWYETDQVPMLAIFRWLQGAINSGEAYEKMPRVIPYLALPIGALLMLVRIVQVTVEIWRGSRETLIASHEAEDAVEQAARGEFEE